MSRFVTLSAPLARIDRRVVGGLSLDPHRSAVMQGTRLKRSQDRMIAGVCAGLAEWLGWKADRVRVAYVILSILSAAFPGILIYLLLWLLMPDADA